MKQRLNFSLTYLLINALLLQLCIPYGAMAEFSNTTLSVPAHTNPYTGDSITAQILVAKIWEASSSGSGGTNGQTEKGDAQKSDDSSSKEPIDTTTGNNYFTEYRLNVPAQGVPLVIDLEYQSVSPRIAGSLGTNWCHSLEWSLANIGTTNPLILSAGTGDRHAFDLEAEGSYRANNNWRIEQEGLFYHLKQPSGVEYIFTPAGRLTRIQNGWGVGVTCYNNENGLIERALHDNGRELTFSYLTLADGKERVASISVTGGASLEFAYNDLGQISHINEQVGEINYPSTYLYDGDGNLTNKTNRAGYEYDYAYQLNKGTYLNADGYYPHSVQYANQSTDVIYERRGGQRIERYQRNSDGELIFHYTGSSYADLEDHGIEYQYNEAGDKTLTRTFDNVSDTEEATHLQYDAQHNVTNRVYSINGGQLVPQEAMQYTPEGQLASTTEPDGTRTEFTYINGSPHTIQTGDTQTAFGYNADGQLIATTNANGNVTTMHYTQAGDIEQIVPSLGTRQRMEYNALGFMTKLTFLSERGEDTGRSYRIERDAHGRETARTFPDGTTTHTRYNGLGEVVQTTDRAGRVTDYERVPTALKSVTRYLHEGGTSTPVRVSYTLDEQTNLLQIEEPSGRYVESYQLDNLDRVTSVTNIEGQVLSMSYLIGDKVESLTRFDDSALTYSYNEAGLLAETIYPDATLTNTYFADGQIASRSDGTSEISYQYNLNNRLTHQAVSGEIDYSLAYLYNAGGNPTNQAVQVGSTTLELPLSYDSAERLIQSGSDHYTYSPTHGQLESVSNSVVTAHYSYDLLDQLTGITYHNAQGEPIKTIEYERDQAGMITTKREDGTTTHYAYDSLDRLLSESTADGTTHYRYDLAGNRTAKINNGVATTYTLGTGNRLSHTTTHSTNLLSVVGTMNEPIGTDDRWGTLSVSNLTTAEGTKPQVGGAKYVADLTGLEGASNTIVSAIRDRAGNMAYNTTHLYLPATEASSTTSYAYDEAGNLTARGEQSLTWDSRYRLTSATSEAGIINYSYDLLNRRTARTADGETEHYIYDGHHIVADVTTAGELLRTYTYGQRIDAIQSMRVYGAETNTYHYLRDHLNSVVGLVDESGNIVESYSYDAYGNTHVFNAEGEEIERSAIGNRYAFQGREIDWDTGLYNFRARWYDSETGRWLNKDPIGIEGGLNLYEAFGNNAVNFVDPFGLEKNQMKQLAGAFGLAAAADLTKTGLQLMATGNIPAIIGGAALVTAGIILGKGSLNLIRN